MSRKENPEKKNVKFLFTLSVTVIMIFCKRSGSGDYSRGQILLALQLQ